MATANCGQAGGTDGDCEGEDQEDPSSSHFDDLPEEFDSLNLQDVQSGDDELAMFRQQWQRELDSTPSPRKESKPQDEPQEPLSEEERAKDLFLKGVELERRGKLYEAIQHYKRAMQILPDVETRLYESTDLRNESPEVDLEPETVVHVAANLSDDEDYVEGEDLLTRLQRILARKGILCEQEFSSKEAHISWLPYEVILLILRWVVSSDLDAISLERTAAACRGFYVAAREPDIWRSICVKTWGIECGTPRANGYTSWRNMYSERPRLQLNGCYISKTTYLRPGENSFQDHFYRPWHLIDYYRYLRFFPEGVVLTWTTAEEPASCVGHLKHRNFKAGLGILSGHYRLMGDKVVIVIKKPCEKRPVQPSHTRFRSRRREPVADQHDTIFHMELQVRSVRGRRNWQLAWRGYSVSARRDQWTQFDLTASKFPPFAFSRVRTYTVGARAPLAHCNAYA